MAQDTRTYTIVKGDTLTSIAARFKTTVAELVRLNNIADPDLIIAGDTLVISGDPVPTETNTTYIAEVNRFGLLSNSDNTLYATWTWDKDHTEKYQVRWKYLTADGVWLNGSNTAITVDENDPQAAKQSTYTIPSNAKAVTFEVKPISKKKNNSDAVYWEAKWSTKKQYNVTTSSSSPGTPTVEIDENLKLTATLDNITLDAKTIEFQVVRNDKSVYKTGKATITTGHASYSCTVASGYEYKVRCRALGGFLPSEWSAYSSNVGTIPASVSSISECRATSETSIYVSWPVANNAKTYDLEYATERRYFDGSDRTSIVTGIETTHYEKTGLESGQTYFFRVRAVNKDGQHSSWSSIRSTIIGEEPEAPTTWSSTTTAVCGDLLILYWAHNSADGSSQTFAELQLTVNDQVLSPIIVRNSTDEDEKYSTSMYVIKTSRSESGEDDAEADITLYGIDEGATITWKVRTAGVTNTLGDWSIERTIDVYAPPTLDMQVTGINGEHIDMLGSFPFYISALAGPNTQMPIGYHVSVVATEGYETVDSLGNEVLVNAGSQVYSKHFDTSDALLVEMSAGNIDLENNIRYTITCTVSMNSGLTAEATADITVGWTDIRYEPNAEIDVDTETYSAHIRPHCEDENGDPIPGVLLAVYRREFDGEFVKLIDRIPNGNNIYITDPHPALDYARYRIVATSEETGAVTYCDIPGHPINGKAAIIQWDEAWNGFESVDGEMPAEPSWSGSMLKLPYNIDVSDDYATDVSLVEYIGRKRPVSYYGTQLGHRSTWSMAIEKSDRETLSGLRRLAMWTGDVYVREPSGSGYWASITVNFSQKHGDLTIPVSIDVVRVEGGI